VKAGKVSVGDDRPPIVMKNGQPSAHRQMCPHGQGKVDRLFRDGVPLHAAELCGAAAGLGCGGGSAVMRQ
jgi:hypothetical protein